MELMNWNDFLDVMDMDDPACIAYFEDVAQLFEIKEDIPKEYIQRLIQETDMEELDKLIKEYFEEITVHLEDIEIYTLMTEISNGMTASINLRDENCYERLTDEIAKFRVWYLDDGAVKQGERNLCVSDALCEIRADKLVGKTSHYDFEQAMEYDLREYTMFVDIERDDDIMDDI